MNCTGAVRKSVNTFSKTPIEWLIGLHRCSSLRDPFDSCYCSCCCCYICFWFHILILYWSYSHIYNVLSENITEVRLGLRSSLTCDVKKTIFFTTSKLKNKYPTMFWDGLRVEIWNISTNEVVFPKKPLFCFINLGLDLLSEKTHCEW